MVYYITGKRSLVFGYSRPVRERYRGMGVQYTHLELEKDVYGFAGFYTPMKEVRLKHNDREILYIVGQATVESSCCATRGTLAYATVPGYVVAWKSHQNEAGLAVSDVEPVADREARQEIAHRIRKAEGIESIEFW